MSKDKMNFEDTLAQLQKTVEALEQGNLPLEESLSQFQHAVTLSKACQKTLEQAELKISQISQEGKLVDPPEIDQEDKDA